MKVEELIGRTSLRAAGRAIGLDVQVVEGRLESRALDPDDPRYSTDFILPSMRMVDACRADDFDFFRPWLEAGQLTVGQMQRAAARYHLGKTRSGQPLFWMIDEMLDPLNAHMLPDAWLSTALKRREPLLRYWRPAHCLFGLHLLYSQEAAPNAKPDLPVAIVESEQTAVVLSELIPESIWMAYVSMAHMDAGRLAPLQGRTVTVYPPADPTSSTFLSCEELAATLRQQYRMNITVASILEDNATDAQRERCIDLLDFILERNS